MNAERMLDMDPILTYTDTYLRTHIRQTHIHAHDARKHAKRTHTHMQQPRARTRAQTGEAGSWTGDHSSADSACSSFDPEFC